jgi:hypothetical protein
MKTGGAKAFAVCPMPKDWLATAARTLHPQHAVVFGGDRQTQLHLELN